MSYLRSDEKCGFGRNEKPPSAWEQDLRSGFASRTLVTCADITRQRRITRHDHDFEVLNLDTFFRFASFSISSPRSKDFIDRLIHYKPITITITMLAASSRTLLRSSAASVGSKTVLKSLASRQNDVSAVLIEKEER
jgi:hypothetical protein